MLWLCVVTTFSLSLNYHTLTTTGSPNPYSKSWSQRILSNLCLCSSPPGSLQKHSACISCLSALWLRRCVLFIFPICPRTNLLSKASQETPPPPVATLTMCSSAASSKETYSTPSISLDGRKEVTDWMQKQEQEQQSNNDVDIGKKKVNMPCLSPLLLSSMPLIPFFSPGHRKHPQTGLRSSLQHPSQPLHQPRLAK